ncbi:amino acid permease [Microdochium trichocladiopsis]|uniref:Amino acid permease n=1 Tax=Microdochium trichocladiopsis TaxID=1682393 RepID=A0A9P9BKQ4_9PEZI|nr:amino acid permease [Microdochium trichocladiopsis]KAH7021494.1 amino acid permease [Microdochium trichocladiopsis]
MEDDVKYNDMKKDDLATLEAAVSRPIAGVSDEIRLAQLGHKQELNRGFSVLALGSLVLCLMATWEALSTVISSALVSGGPPCLFYNYILAFIGTMAIVLSLSEICSIYPTAGGQYHWVAVLAPPERRAAVSWAVGWISVSGQIVLTASAAFAAGLQFQSLIAISDETYDRPRWQGMLFYWAVVVYATVVNIFGVKLLPNVNLVAGVLHIAGLAAIMVTLGVMSEKNTPDFVFTEVVNSSGWANDGISWLIGLQSAVFPMLGYDAACHLAEELPNASRNVPIAMLGGTAVNGVLGFAYAILLLFSTSPLDALLSTPTGFPFMQIFLDVTGSKAGSIVMSLIPCILATVGGIAGLASASRTLWAFARDEGLPFASYFSHVQPKVQVPVRAVVVVSVLQLLLGLLYLGNVTAFNAVLSLSIICSYLSHIMPIYYMVVRGRPTMERSRYGAFVLSKFMGNAINIVAIMWIILVVVFSFFPLTMPVTPDNMNYSLVVLVGWLIFGLGYYYLGGGNRKYQVPYHDLAVEDHE